MRITPPTKHRIATALAATLAMAAGPAVAREHLTGQQQLAKLLAGRVAGQPVDCISLRNAGSSQIIDGTAIVFDSGAVLYVNQPAYPEALDSDQILITKTWGDQLCRLDIVRLRDRGTHMDAGFVGLESFVPYRRAPKVAVPEAAAPSAAPPQPR